MVRLITQRGPRIDEISREIGVYKETTRYWFNQLLRNGFTVQASRNHENLGLNRVIIIASPTEGYREYADAILYSLGELAYIVSFAKTLPDNQYVMQGSVPSECLESWLDFMRKLKEMGIFGSMEIIKAEWARNVPMWVEFYNFQTGTWEFDWGNTRVNPFAAQVDQAKRQKYDKIDLQILEQLQLNGDMPLTEMGRKLGIKYKLLCWHYRNHVLGRDLVKSYLVNWTGAKYDLEAEKPQHRKHRYAWVDVLATGVTEGEKMRMMTAMHRTPFVWLEASGLEAYYARMVFPVEEMPEALEFLEKVVALARGKVKWYHMDQAHALWFTLAATNFDETNQKWAFNSSELLARFETLVQTVTQGKG